MFKQFLATPWGKLFRTLIAGGLASVFALLLNQLTSLPIAAVWVPVITAVIMAAEDFLRKNGWLSDQPTTQSK